MTHDQRYGSLLQTMRSMVFITCLKHKTWGMAELIQTCKAKGFDMLPESVVKSCIKDCESNGWCEKSGKVWRSSL